ncbi:MAG: hypothetical protein H6617_06080 [Bdellovibrionaceae bacterium]|nr:hypothetical protein [Bdellovibrionales bacterium]MCB9254232.1 hypothetical protein [Pseudobdellovibrionaceae bacterium]
MLRTLSLLRTYKHYWIWPLVAALAVFLLLALTSTQDAATPYIYNLN